MARKRHSARELSDVIGVAEHTAGRRLNGQTPFNAIEMARIAKWLGTSVAELTARAEQRSPGAAA
ncbi:helix-turn-helix domain-containing protein [Microbacterium sp. gxy059]